MKTWLLGMMLFWMVAGAFTASADVAKVGVGNRLFFTLAGLPGLPAAEREKIVNQRLVEVFTPLRVGEDPQVSIKVESGDPVIWAMGKKVVTVTTADALLHLTSVAGLASVWRARADAMLRIVAPAGPHGSQAATGNPWDTTPKPGHRANPAETVPFD